MKRLRLTLILVLLTAPELHAGIELNFWHSYTNRFTNEPGYSFHIIDYKRGLFFSHGGLTTRSEKWSYSLQLAGVGPVYSSQQIKVATIYPHESVTVDSGSVSIDPKQKTVTIGLRITDNGKIMDFVGNGTHRIRNSD